MKPELKLISMEEIPIEKVRWLWRPYIPLGKLTLVQGDPGEGKTTFALALIAALTRGEALPGGTATEPMNVIYQTAEDGLADTIKPRLVASGADCSRVLVIDEDEKALSFCDARLEEAVRQTDARLVVLDPIQAYVGEGVDMHRANEVRPLLKRLGDMAQRNRCAVLLVGHVNKQQGTKSTYRNLGTIDFPAAARSVLVAAGILLGGALAEPAVQAASGVWAERDTNAIYVDGRQVELEAYNIGGANYVRLRDVGALVGFNVYYDGTVRIESGVPYTGEAPSPVDYSRAANPVALNEVYTREAYNAASEVLAGVRVGDLSRTGQVFYADPEDARRYERNLADLANGTTLSLRGVDRGGLYEVFAHTVDWSAADAATEELIREVSQLPTDREKVIRLSDWICDRVIYNPKVVVGVNEIATSPEPVEGNCSSFARMLNYLCGRLGIPCLRVAGESHAWNLVYADGAWGYVDVSLNDQVRNRDAMLLTEIARKRSSDPEGVRFLQELLVPGSTK